MEKMFASLSDIQFKNIVIYNNQLTATTYIGGVVGCLADGATTLNESMTNNITLQNVSYRGYLYQNSDEYDLWNGQIDRDTQNVTLSLTRETDHVEKETIQYLNSSGAAVTAVERELVTPEVYKIVKAGLFYNKFDIQNLNYFIGNNPISFNGTIIYDNENVNEISIFMIDYSIDSYANLSNYNFDYSYTDISGAIHDHSHTYSTYEEYESSYNSTALDTCSNSTSDDYENIRKYYVVEYTKLDRVDSPNLAVMDITYAELHSVILKKA